MIASWFDLYKPKKCYLRPDNVTSGLVKGEMLAEVREKKGRSLRGQVTKYVVAKQH